MHTLHTFHGLTRFTRPATATFLLLTAAAFLGGCGSLTSGTTVAKYTKGDNPGPPVVVERGGTFALYYTTDTTPEARTAVHDGDRVGFEPATADTYAAVAGEYRREMPKDVYKAYWKRVSDK